MSEKTLLTFIGSESDETMASIFFIARDHASKSLATQVHFTAFIKYLVTEIDIKANKITFSIFDENGAWWCRFIRTVSGSAA